MIHNISSVFTVIFVLFACVKCVSADTPSGKVDILDYFLQSADTENKWTLNGTDVREGSDPDGNGSQTFILNKFNSPDFYEVFKLQGDELQIRYEVFRIGGKDGKGSWIRRFQDIGRAGKAPGSIWTKRYITMGGAGEFTKFRQDKYIFDEASRSYVIDESGSIEYFPNYTRFEFADVNYGRNNESGFKINRVLRMISEWQREGNVIETYDYAKGLGMVNWRWLERISALPRVNSEKVENLYRCMDGVVQIIPSVSDEEPPLVFSYDIKSSKQIKPLDVVSMTSVWRKGLGEQWYVVYRDARKEDKLKKSEIDIRHDFSLPEWTSKPGASIKDLPYKYTSGSD